MDWVNDTAPEGAKKGPKSFSVETQCAAEGFPHCVFEVTPLAA
jgi:predicted hydrocarbon binding protein